jgi:hypothetical protein
MNEEREKAKHRMIDFVEQRLGFTGTFLAQPARTLVLIGLRDEITKQLEPLQDTIWLQIARDRKFTSGQIGAWFWG